MRKASSVRFSQPKNILAALQLEKRDIVIFFLLLFVSRAWLPGGMVPFAFPAYAAVFVSHRCRMRPTPSLFFAAAAMLGPVTLGEWWQVFVLLVAVLFFFGFLWVDSRVTGQKWEDVSDNKRLTRPVKMGLYLVLSQALSGILAVSLQDAPLSDVFLLMLQTAIGFVAFYIFRLVMNSFTDDVSRKIMTNEEMACIAITAAVAIMGLPDVLLFGISLRRLLCITIIMIFSYRGGLGTGAAAGVTVGILITASTMTSGGSLSATVISLYAFCGFLSGLLNKYKKLGVSIGFLLGNVLMAALLTANAEIIINLYEIGFAIILFLLLPEKTTSFLKLPQLTGVKIPTVKVNYAEKLRKTAKSKLQCFSGILREMAGVCGDLTELEAGKEKNELLQIMDRTTDRICSKCALCSQCWEMNFYQTYQCFLSLLYTLERQGRIPSSDVPDLLAKTCPNLSSVAYEMRHGFEIWRVEKLWKKRLEETKTILPAQLAGMAEILDNLALEIDLSVQFMDHMERNILQELEAQELRARAVTVARNKYGRYEVTIECKCCGGAKQCVTSYLPILSKVMNVPFTLQSECCCGGERGVWCPVSFVEEEPFRAVAAVAGHPARNNPVSGDAHSFLPLEQGIYMAALSDGMGSGERAAKQSGAVIKLLELFLESGLNKTSAVSLINSLLETGAAEKEMSATVDLALLNLYEGKVSFLKLGAMPSLIKKKDHVETVVVSGTPVGLILEEEQSQSYQPVERTLEDGDFVILFSDGILETYQDNGYRDMDFYSAVENIRTGDPQQLAERILTMAEKLCQGQPKDDMTVMAVKIWRRD